MLLFQLVEPSTKKPKKKVAYRIPVIPDNTKEQLKAERKAKQVRVQQSFQFIYFLKLNDVSQMLI